ncbi:hypothetical protein NDU88_005100 [Pleurodeles waltl]|uniref:Uncharacterized protein n=1 Tax=Pleurodeles waltl TaxID=8319 RepID=A0AAV7QEC6_PLEWA|nr:hypothetical protein NDU88_005100 [Pleurodeles waltl]
MGLGAPPSLQVPESQGGTLKSNPMAALSAAFPFSQACCRLAPKECTLPQASAQVRVHQRAGFFVSCYMPEGLAVDRNRK